MLTAPPPRENTEGEILRSQHGGAELLFYWSTFVIRLCFGSFIVAILVSAFNKVVANEAEAKATLTRDASIPPEFSATDRRTFCESVCHFIDFLLTARIYASYEPRLTGAIETKIARVEMEDDSGTAKKEQIVIAEEDLGSIVGTRPAALLIRAHGCYRRATEASTASGGPLLQERWSGGEPDDNDVEAATVAHG